MGGDVKIFIIKKKSTKLLFQFVLIERLARECIKIGMYGNNTNVTYVKAIITKCK